MKLIVCGGTKFGMRFTVRAFLDALHMRSQITCIMDCGNLGAGRHARAWAIEHKVPHHTHEADYDEHGNSAWVQRNAEMLTGADAVLAFPGIGADGMVEQARKAGVMVYEPFS